MRVSEIFKSIQGEGKYVGTPMLFIRLSGCTRHCSWCDTKYHTEGKEISINKIAKIIDNSKLNYVCWTGGEPLLWLKEIKEIKKLTLKEFHLETNGDLIEDFSDLTFFDCISCSPKEEKIAKKISQKNKESDWLLEFDIKIVTDLETEGVDMLKYATMLMPFSTFDEEKDKEIRSKVWDYCMKHNIRYCPRLHYEVKGNKRGV